MFNFLSFDVNSLKRLIFIFKQTNSQDLREIVSHNLHCLDEWIYKMTLYDEPNFLKKAHYSCISVVPENFFSVFFCAFPRFPRNNTSKHRKMHQSTRCYIYTGRFRPALALKMSIKRHATLTARRKQCNDIHYTVGACLEWWIRTRCGIVCGGPF